MIGGFAARCFGLAVRAVRGFRPRGRPTFLCAQESRQRRRPCKTAHPSGGCPAMLEAQGRAELAPLRSAQTSGAKSVLEACCARALGFCASRRFRRGGPKQPTRKPTAKPESRLAPAVHHSPFEPAEERRPSSPFAQRTSRTDSRRLFEQSVATRVRRAGLKVEHRREARCAAKGRAVRGRLFAYFLVAQKVGRPPGRTPGMGLGVKPQTAEQTQ